MNLAFPKIVKRKKKQREGMSKKHLENLRQLGCCICGDLAEVHHLKQGIPLKERGMGRRAADRYAVPLCHTHHINGVETLSSKSETAWFIAKGIFDPVQLAEDLWNAKDIEEMKAVMP